MREFKLYNSTGKYYDLNSTNSFLSNPRGLGYESNDEYETIGSQYILKKSEIKQPEPAGTIKFPNYEEYFEFVKFIQRTPLKLLYKAAGLHTMQCRIKQIEKTELETGGLYIGIQFEALSQWYKTVTEKTREDLTIGKYYPYSYNYTYSDKASGTVVIQSDSENESPVILTIIGPCKNPSWVHYINDVVVASGRMNITVEEGKRLIISSELPYSIYLTDDTNSIKEDVYQYSDFLTERFVHLQYGENKITFFHEGENEINAAAEGRILYVSV